MSENRESSPYWPNAVGFLGVIVLLIFMCKGCDELLIEREKTEQIKILKGK